jgi:hypothetical protein
VLNLLIEPVGDRLYPKGGDPRAAQVPTAEALARDVLRGVEKNQALMAAASARGLARVAVAGLKVRRMPAWQ